MLFIQRYEDCGPPSYKAYHAFKYTLPVEDYSRVVVPVRAVEAMVEQFRRVAILAIEDLK